MDNQQRLDHWPQATSRQQGCLSVPNCRPATPNTCSTTLAGSELRWSAIRGRSVRVGSTGARARRVPGAHLHEIEAKSILNRVPGDYLPFDWTINPYRGCSHACVYCFARPTHEYLGFDIADEFDSQIVVKINAVELARAETSPRWSGDSPPWGRTPIPISRPRAGTGSPAASSKSSLSDTTRSRS